MATRPFSSRLRPGRRLGAVVIAGILVAAGCSSSDEAETGTDEAASDSTSSEPVIVGYSAWPGWFPLVVAEEQGFFEDVGLDVQLEFFADYTASLDALVAEQVDINAQTLSDTIFAVSAGADQKVVVVGDNSTGNDAIICDESIGSIAELEGKTVAAEAGVVDHFLLLQGLATEGLTEADIDFQGVKTDAAAAAFAGGEFDCVGVFAPFTLQALERPGSKVLFSSADFPGVIPDHFVATGTFAEERPEDVQKFVEAWYMTLDFIENSPDEANAIMAEAAELSVEEYAELAEGTTLFGPDEAVSAFEDRPGDPTSLPEMARRINPFLVESGLAEQEADLEGLFLPEFTISYAESR
jgi:NitT/TauT family transport system substrate-binding protein